MPCYKPLSAQRLDDGSVSFSARNGAGDPLTIPCGQCLGCRLDRSRMWAIRCVHEASLWENNCFLTLTYNDEHLPRDWSLDYTHFQGFMKRLRFHHKGMEPGLDGNYPFRFYMCGEYGERNMRPHYHALLFNFDFKDKKPWTKQNNHLVHVSENLQSLWPYGFSTIGALTMESAAYCARYVMKKVTGTQSRDHYRRVDPQTGEITWLIPEFCNMSRKPGVGLEWIRKHHPDVYPHDFVVTKTGKKMKPPRYYDDKFEDIDGYTFEDVQQARVERRKAIPLSESSPERLAVKEAVQQARVTQLKRSIEQ